MSFADKKRIKELESSIKKLEDSVFKDTGENDDKNGDNNDKNDHNGDAEKSKNSMSYRDKLANNENVRDNENIADKTNNKKVADKNDDESNSKNIESIMDKAKAMIGISPVNTEHIRHYVPEEYKIYNTIEEFNKEECKYARKQAAIEFLVKELKFHKDDIIIKSTKIANSDRAQIL